MVSDPELFALLDQATRNIDTLELLIRSAGEQDESAVLALRERLEALKHAYTHETNALTRQVLKRAVERRMTVDRRRTAASRTA